MFRNALALTAVTALFALSVGAAPGDDDSDGVPNATDNCSEIANPDQRDTDRDGFGNACDADYNNDGRVDEADHALFKTAFGSSAGDPNFNADVDHDGDGTVGIGDMRLVQGTELPGPSGLACAGSTPCPAD